MWKQVKDGKHGSSDSSPFSSRRQTISIGSIIHPEVKVES